jgi:hypothetical protein
MFFIFGFSFSDLKGGLTGQTDGAEDAKTVSPELGGNDQI